MIRALLFALVLLLPSIAEAKPRRHAAAQREVVQVVDSTSAIWDGIVQETVADFNAIMPPKGPVLVYVRGGVGCSSVIPICSTVLPDNIFGMTFFFPSERYARIQVTDAQVLTQSGKEGVACHEMMHALTHIGDNYGANPNSCVWGELPDPGAFDIDYLWRYFGSPPPHHAKPKKPCKHIKSMPHRKACQRNHRR